MSHFNSYIHHAMHEIDHIHDMKLKGDTLEHIKEAEDLLHWELKIAHFDLMEALLFSLVQLFFPIKLMINSYFMNRTNRSTALVTGITFIDLALFIGIMVWANDFLTMDKYDITNKWLEEVGDSGPSENLMMNIIWKIHCGSTIDDAEACVGHHY